MLEEIDQIQNFWKDSLAKIHLKDALRELIPSESQNFLEEIGLPLAKGIEDRLLARFGFDDNQFKVFEFGGDTYLQVWEEENERLVIRQHTDQVFWLNISTPPLPIDGKMLFQPVQFVNSSIQAYMTFLTYYVMSLPRRNELFGADLNPQQNLSPEAIEAKRLRYFEEHKNILDGLIKRFEKIDKIAMGNKENYWTLKLSREAALFYV